MVRQSQSLKKGSITVEASFLLPFLIFVICMLFTLCMYLHDKSFLTSCAAELAGKGAMEKYKTKEELEALLREQAAGIAEGRLLTLKEFELCVTVTEQSVTVAYTGRTELLGGLDLQAQQTAKRLDPVDFIRSSARLEEILDVRHGKGIEGWR